MNFMERSRESISSPLDREDCGNLMDELDSMLGIIQELTMKEKEQSMQTYYLKERNAALEQEIKCARKEIDRLENLVEELYRVSISKLEDAVQRSSIFSSFPQHLEALSKENETLRTENKSLKDLLNRCEESVALRKRELLDKANELDSLKATMEVIQKELKSDLQSVVDSNNLALLENLRAEIEASHSRQQELEEKLSALEDKHQRVIKQKDLEYNLLRIDYMTNLQGLNDRAGENDAWTPPKPNKNRGKDPLIADSQEQSTKFITKKITLTNRQNADIPQNKTNNAKKRKYAGDGDKIAITRRDIQTANSAIDYHLTH